MNGNYLIAKYLPDLDYIQKNSPRQYEVLVIDLTVAQIDKRYIVLGNSLTITVLPVETDKYVKVKINSKESDEITLEKNRRIETTIHSIFVTNNAYSSGAKLEIVIGIGLAVK